MPEYVIKYYSSSLEAEPLAKRLACRRRQFVARRLSVQFPYPNPHSTFSSLTPPHITTPMPFYRGPSTYYNPMAVPDTMGFGASPIMPPPQPCYGVRPPMLQSPAPLPSYPTRSTWYHHDSDIYHLSINDYPDIVTVCCVLAMYCACADINQERAKWCHLLLLLSYFADSSVCRSSESVFEFQRPVFGSRTVEPRRMYWLWRPTRLSSFKLTRRRSPTATASVRARTKPPRD